MVCIFVVHIIFTNQCPFFLFNINDEWLLLIGYRQRAFMSCEFIYFLQVHRIHLHSFYICIRETCEFLRVLSFFCFHKFMQVLASFCRTCREFMVTLGYRFTFVEVHFKYLRHILFLCVCVSNNELTMNSLNVQVLMLQCEFHLRITSKKKWKYIAKYVLFQWIFGCLFTNCFKNNHDTFSSRWSQHINSSTQTWIHLQMSLIQLFSKQN